MALGPVTLDPMVLEPAAPALDTLIVFGYGPVEAGAKLNVYARLSALAAGMLLEQGKTKRVLVTGGQTGGEALPAEAELMACYLGRNFQLAPEQIVLETHASDTIDNLVLSANLLDVEGRSQDRLGFLALQLHGPRIAYLADLVGLKGEFTALERVVAARSARHRRLLGHLKTTPSYARLAASQVRAMRGLRELPGFWLPPLGKLGTERLRRLQQHPALSGLGLPDDLNAFRQALLTMLRRYPEPQPDDVRRGLEATYG